jgi:hypothetical protein
MFHWFSFSLRWLKYSWRSSAFSVLSCGKTARSSDIATKKDRSRHPLRVIACRLATYSYNTRMVKRTSPSDAHKISVAADLEELVQDKREGWRASGAKARRRQRRYKALLTQQLMKVGTHPVDDDPMDDDL